MARGFYPGVEGVSRKGAKIYGGVDEVARKIAKAYAGVGGVARQVWPRCTWQRYAVEDLTTYYWDKYSAVATTEYTGGVSVRYTTGSQTVTWSPKYPRNDPPRINTDRMIWDNLASGTWDGWDAPGDWIVRSTSLNYNCYYVTSLEQASGSAMRFTYSRIAVAETQTIYSKGTTYYGQVSSTNAGAYHPDNYSGGYWYTYTGSTTEQVKGTLIDTVFGNESEYPDDGIQGGYWYVRVE